MTATGRPANIATTNVAENSRIENGISSEFATRCSRTQRSALWAAYGDALGWISELTDSKGLKRRTGGGQLCRPIAWTRRIGGRSGITTLLPEGCYSDDSQLRLATGRAIGPNGFDVEAFAKVELPVWLSYGLGGGKSTSAAAVNLSRPSVPWFANTFKGWNNSGGNGAAMRIQPHVWATPALDDPESYLPDVVRNTICTHSHPIGLLGSIVHALTLAHTMATGHNPSIDELLTVTKDAIRLPETMRKDTEVGSYWRGTFERESGAFDYLWSRAIIEYEEALAAARRSNSSANAAGRYAALVERLKLRDPARRGSGILTAIASVGLLSFEAEPESAMRIAANEVGTDTDTIASMAGALVGAAADSDPPNGVLDASLFRSEAIRLTQIACGAHSEIQRYPYPDLLHWSPPSRRADTLVLTRDGDLYVRGLGPAQIVSGAESSSSGDFQWQWVMLESGQSLLIKRRAKLPLMEDDIGNLTGQGSQYPTSIRGDEQLPHDLVQQSTEPKSHVEMVPPKDSGTISKRAQSLDLQLALDYMTRHKDNDKALGAALRRVVDKGTPGQIAAFTAALVDELRNSEKARQERHG